MTFSQLNRVRDASSVSLLSLGPVDNAPDTLDITSLVVEILDIILVRRRTAKLRI